MNVIDCLAIAPYYLTLFFVPAPEMGPVDVSGDVLSTLAPDLMEEEGESSFGNVGRIMQVSFSDLQTNRPSHNVLDRCSVSRGL